MAICDKRILLAVAALLVSAAPIASAQQKMDESGIDSMTNNHEIIELGKDHTLVLVHQEGIETTSDPTMPTNMTAIDCHGMIDNMPDKTSKGSGYCVLVDRDGDKIFQRWFTSSDAADSTYETIGGTGKFEGAKGQGTARDTEIIAGAQGRSLTHWKGVTEYPKLKTQ